MTNPAAGAGYEELGLTGASSSRLTDYFLGGKTHYPPDRKLADALERNAPLWRRTAMINRAYGHSTTLLAARRGIRQFLDLGCGFPTPWTGRTDSNSVHSVLVDADATAAVVYVDRDPIAMAHNRALVVDDAGVSVAHVEADVRDMKRLLAEPELVDTFDVSEPIAVTLHDVLPWITRDEDVQDSLAVLRGWLPAGSLLSITHLTTDFQPATVAALAEVYDTHNLPVRPRDLEQLVTLFGGYKLLGPGLVATGLWHAQHPHAQLPPVESAAYAGIAVKEAP